MNSIDFVKLACSKDAFKPNMQEVYRDKTELVGTDGHRLHWADGLQEVEKPHYLSGSGATFPEWKQCIPTAEPAATFKLIITPDFLKYFKAVAAMAKLNEPKTQALKLCWSDETLFLRTASNRGDAMISTTICEGEGEIETKHFNASYLLDVFASAVKFQATSKIIINAYPGVAGPWIFEIPLVGKALIMPQRA